MKKVEEKTFRFYEVSFYILAVSIIVLLSIVVYFVGQKPKMCIEYIGDTKHLLNNDYDMNNDGKIDIYDLLEESDKLNDMKEYILNEN